MLRGYLTVGDTAFMQEAQITAPGAASPGVSIPGLHVVHRRGLIWYTRDREHPETYNGKLDRSYFP